MWLIYHKMTLSSLDGLLCLWSSYACSAIVIWQGGVISRLLHTTFPSYSCSSGLIHLLFHHSPSSYKFYVTHSFCSALAPNEALTSSRYKPCHCGCLGHAIQGLLWFISIAQIVPPWLLLGFNTKAANWIWAQGTQLCSVFPLCGWYIMISKA